MQYRNNPKNGDRLSLLGLGCMRFPNKGLKVDEQAGIAIIQQALASGVNYFDTAYVYHNGFSEGILGKALADGARDRVKIATKMPHYLVRSYHDLERIFKTQLQRLQTDHIDYYLMHMLSDVGIWRKLEELGIKQWVQQRKAAGEIINFGFSFHGRADNFLALLAEYPWDFCQLQYNYLDENNQAGRSGLQQAAKQGLPVIIMEPLRGGKLIDGIGQQAQQLIKDKGKSPAELGLAWVYDQPEVTVVLSGMSSCQQVIDNALLTDQVPAGSLDATAKQLINEVKSLIQSQQWIPCSSCRYCLPCPQGVDIPGCFAAYNDKHVMKTKSSWMFYMQSTGAFTAEGGNAGKCVGCGLCKKHCPQNIDIPEQLKLVKKELENPLFQIVRVITKLIMGKKAKKKAA